METVSVIAYWKLYKNSKKTNNWFDFMTKNLQTLCLKGIIMLQYRIVHAFKTTPWDLNQMFKNLQSKDTFFLILFYF